jgi:uncharacterized membrane protein YphA (DoxX/SURF4 family)
VPVELALEVEKVQPRITADSLVEVYLEPERLTMDLTAVFTVERSGVFRLELDKPAGYQVRQVRGRELPGVAAAQVDTWHEEGEKKTRLVVNLSRKAKDKVGLLIELQQDLGQRELLTQPGKTADIPIEVPTVPTAPGGIAERATGRLVIYAPESLQVNPGKPAGLGEAPLEKAMENIPSARDAKPGNARPVLPYTFAQEAVKLGLSVERRKPDVKIYQLLVARIDAGVVRYEAGLNYEVLYSGVKSLRLDVPADVTAALRNETSGVEKTPFDPQPDDVDKDYVALRFTAANKEFFGKGRIDLVIEQKLDEPGAKGKAAAAGLALKVPVLKPRQVERAWGHLVIAKAEALDVIAPAKLDGLQPKDPHKDLPAPVTGAAQAFEFQDKWSLTLNVRQYELEDVKRTSIERGVVRMVVTPAGEVTVQALYRMRSARQRLELKLDGKVEFAAMPLRIDGKAVSLEKDPTGQYFIPLTDSNPERPFLLELHYTTPGDGRDLALPVFPQESAVLKVYLCAYLPNDRVLMGAAGPWTEEFRWWLDQSLTWRPVPRLVDNQQLNDKQLLRWVAEGVQVAGDPADRLQPQGSLYTYSTLRPAEKGRLDLRTMNKNLLHALVFIAAVLGGVLLLPTGLAGRAAAIGAAVVAIVLAGVFLPTAAMQILDGVFLSAVFVVLVLWVVWYFVRTRPRWAAERAAAAAQAPVAPVVVGPQTPTKPLGGLGAGIDLTKQPPPADAPKPEAAPPPADTAPPSPPAGTGEGGPSHG